jgi:hypothetical protein
LGTGCLITGFAQKGEDLEPFQITNRSAWLLKFGAPTNEAEEYFYNAGMEVLNQGGFLYAAKIPYSNDIAGIYAAAKYRISENRELYYFDKEQGQVYYDKLLPDGSREYLEEDDDQPNGVNGKFYQNYASMKDMGLNSLQLISPEGQDFLSMDLVDEYETGESSPALNTIYLVDKTRAVYTRAVEIAEKRDERDSRYCIGIVPVITTMCNTAYFQRKSTGVKAPVDELYQPVRNLRTIEFPAGAASAAEYKPITFQETDLHTQLMSTAKTFTASLSEQAATIAQSCLVNANFVDGKFKPFVCNDVCVVVFKAFVSTEDGKIDFEAVETFIGSLDPMGRDEKGRTTFIDTIVNNNSEYIYCFSNLNKPQRVLNPDHGFVVGSNSDYKVVEEKVKNNREYQAATLFSAYAARMLGFGDPQDVDENLPGLAAPRDYTLELDTNNDDPEMADLAQKTIGSLIQFYNQDAKFPICELNTLAYGEALDSSRIEKLYPAEVASLMPELEGYFKVSDKLITKLPEITYTIKKKDKDKADQKNNSEGTISFEFLPKEDIEDFDLDAYDYEMKMGKTIGLKGETYEPDDYINFFEPDIDTMKLSELSIFNSTDYLRAIYDFENLVDPEAILPGHSADEGVYDSPQWAVARQKAIQSLIINSIEKSGKFKAKLRYLKKAKINLDKLDMHFANSQSTTATESAKTIGAKYVEDLYKSYNDIGVLAGIQYKKPDGKKNSSVDSPDTLLAKKDALEAKLDAIVNIDTTKKEKMKPRSGTQDPDAADEFTLKYLTLKIYLNAQYYQKLADLLQAVADIMEDCAYAQKRYVESQRNIDDANIMLGFYPEMAEPIIAYTTIAQSLNKILDTMSDIHTSEVDVVCDAGISNIAQFVKQVYDPSADDGEDVGGLYEPVKYSSYFKFNKNTDLSYWKTIVYKFDTFCKFRGDCMFCTEGPRSMVLIGNKQVVRKTKKDTNVDINILPYLSKIAGFNTSYGAGYLNWYRTISDYTGDTLWVPPSIKAMGTYILTDKQYNWWDAPAGMRRGVINMVECSFNPNRVQAGEIYDTNWNYAIHYLNDGIIQEGQKTFQTRQSALDRVNVRRLLGRIKRYVYFASRQFLYEPHTQATREKYVKTITPFFQDLVNRGGLYDFVIICDSSNNTPEVIDRNELRVKIGIKPVKTIEFIIIDLCTLNTGASWSEMDSI